MGGPPCRTISALRYQDDDGPRELRSESHPYGLPDLQPHEQELVISDSILWFRMLTLYLLAEDVREPDLPQTALVVEQPEDPARYRSREDVEKYGYMSMWRTREWLDFEERFGIRRINFDQAPMGHPRRKPTTLAVTLPELGALDGVRGEPDPALQGPSRATLTMAQKCQESKPWAAWAPGLKLAIATAVNRWLESFDADKRDLPTLRPLGAVALDAWRKHYMNDHLPARRDCQHCVRTQARGRPHQRVQHPEAFTLSIDLSGKLCEGLDQAKRRCRYLMVGCYTFPVTKAGKPLAPVAGLDEPSDQPLPVPQETHEEGVNSTAGDGEGAGHSLFEQGAEPVTGGNSPLGVEPSSQTDHDLPGLDDVDLGEEPIDEVPGEDDPAVHNSAQTAFDVWHRLVDDSKDVAVKTLTFVEVVQSRKIQHVLPALARIHARLRALGLPVYRLHSDRARELLSQPVRRWSLDREMITTLTSGSSFKSNGRCEAEVGYVKKSIRTIISATRIELQHWHLAAIHAGERRLRNQLMSLGWPVGRLLRFGSKAFALKKSWTDRYQPWRDVREEVIVMGPDVFSSLTSTSYYVKAVTDGRFFFTDDVVIPQDHEVPSIDDPVIHLPERGETPAAVVWGEPPRRRLRGKTAPVQRSMQCIEGENTAVVRSLLHHFEGHVDGHGEHSVSSDSWTLEASETSMSSSSSQEEDAGGGGDREGAPNTWAGGSHPGASRLDLPLNQEEALRSMHCHLADYIQEEMGYIDATSPDQALWLPVLSQAIMKRAEMEETLLAKEDDAQDLWENQVGQEFLVTKTISNKEVWAEFDQWKPAITAEYDQLVVSKKAVEPITKSKLNEMAEKEGLEIEILPAKMVFTRKAGKGVRRARAVVCGNYSSSRQEDERYAGGADGCQVRSVLRTASLREWSVAGTDVRTAFLNAPRRSDRKLVAMEVPAVFRALGLAAEGELWLIRLAMYGLTTSPRDWSIYRDATIPVQSWTRTRQGVEVTGSFVKTPEANLWRIEERETLSGQTHWTGLLTVYVDDLLLTGETETLEAAFSTLSSVWAVSEVEWATKTKPVKFCGFEILVHSQDDGLVLSQQGYEKEMIQRWGVQDVVAAPQIKITEFDEIPDDVVKPADIKTAQAIAGSLLWLSARTRPDLVFGVSTVCRLATKNPLKAIEVGQTLLSYVNGNPGGLHYPRRLQEPWGKRDQLKVKRHDKLIEVFADISYAAGTGHRSIQGIVLFQAGAPVAWCSSVQPFVTHSTAESELVSYCEGLVSGRALESLLASIYGESLAANTFERVLYGDNMAAISLAHGVSTSSWRTRHLRVRASMLHEALEDGSDFPGGPWKLLHLRGTQLVADGTTKALNGVAFDLFVEDLGLLRDGCAEALSPGGSPSNSYGGMKSVAIRTMMVGSLLLTAAEAHPETSNESESQVLWLGGALLMAMGAFYVGQLVKTSSQQCLRRLRLWASENILGPEDEERSWSVTLRAGASVRRRTASQEDEWEFVSNEGDGGNPSPTSAESSTQSGLHGACAASLSSSKLNPSSTQSGLHGACAASLSSSKLNPSSTQSGLRGACVASLSGSKLNPSSTQSGLHGVSARSSTSSAAMATSSQSVGELRLRRSVTSEKNEIAGSTRFSDSQHGPCAPGMSTAAADESSVVESLEPSMKASEDGSVSSKKTKPLESVPGGKQGQRMEPSKNEGGVL